MQPLFTEKQYTETKSENHLPLLCKYCKKTFLIKKHYITKMRNKTQIGAVLDYCSKACNGKAKITAITVVCKQCGTTFKKTKRQTERFPNHFCSQSCAATYHNTHKTKGCRISKLERWLAIKLPIIFPNLEFQFAQKSTINSELDIYIPSLKLAFELNGLFHYEPIFGKEKLSKIQNNDMRKFQACLERNIELCIIDVSKLNYFKEQNAQVYLDIIKSIINLKLQGR